MESPANLHLFNTHNKKTWQVIKTSRRAKTEHGRTNQRTTNSIRSLFLIFPPFLWSQKINCASSLLLLFCMRREPCELAQKPLVRDRSQPGVTEGEEGG